MDNVIIINEKNSDIITRTETNGAELDLVKEFLDYKVEEYKKKRTSYKLAIFCEPQIENAFPDIVFAEYDEAIFDIWNDKRFCLDSQDLKILYHLYYSGGMNAMDVVRQLGFPAAVVLKCIEHLIDAELILRRDSVWTVKEINRFFAVKKIEAVEAKLNQWEAALKQALHNTRFASESYVLSELKKNPTNQTIKKFEGYGIGMYLKNIQGFNKVHDAKESQIPNSYTSLWIGEQIGRAVCRGRL